MINASNSKFMRKDELKRGYNMKDYEQQNLILKFDNQLTKVCDLKRSKTPMTSKIKKDEFIEEANKNFDYDFDGVNKFYPFELPTILKELDFNILCIVGASGRGKSVFSRYFGEETKIEWDNSKAIISNFDNVDEAIERLNSVGLNSIPTWCKPRNVLSIGEGFRADLARSIKDNCVIDEFTSTVDRNVALSCSNSIQRYIRKKGYKRCVFVSCHKDFERNNNWVETCRSGKVSPKQSNRVKFKVTTRTPYSYKYIGKYNNQLDKNNIVLYEKKESVEKKIDQMTIFDV